MNWTFACTSGRTATVESSFSTPDSILSGERCRLTADHVRPLTLHLAVRPEMPDVRDATEQQNAEFEQFVNEAYLYRQKKPHR